MAFPPSSSSGPPTIPFVDLKAGLDELDGAVEAAVGRVASSGWYLLGEELEAFEAEFAAYCGTRYCIGVGSGMSAIELALRALGVGPGDEVIVPAYTWIATWSAVTRAGAAPVGVDVEPGSYNLDPRQLDGALTERTAAILPVHFRGEPAAMAAIAEFARVHDLALVEDAAQAHGAVYGGRRAGSLGDAAAFSFYPAKNLGALGDGGAVTTDDEGVAGRLRLLRNYGMRNRYEIVSEGCNSRLAEIQAAALRVKLPWLDEWNRARGRLAQRYRELLEGEVSLALPTEQSESEPVWHIFTVGCEDRDSLAAQLRRQGIETSIHYPVLPHLAPPYRQLWGRGAFPVAEALADSCLSLPLYPQLPLEACERVASELLAANA